MKIFISWSTSKRSRLVAELFNSWLPTVTSGITLFLSTRDIDSGAQWFTEITANLEETTQGIFCLTHENKEKPWILFEAGSLAKGSAKSRVRTILIDLTNQDITGPLAQFNHTDPKNKEAMLSMVLSINGAVENSVPNNFVEAAFSAHWSKFEDEFRRIISETDNETPEPIKRQPEFILDEILGTVRTVDSRLTQLESIIHNNFSKENIHLFNRNVNSNDVTINIIAGKLFQTIKSALDFRHAVTSAFSPKNKLPIAFEDFMQEIANIMPELVAYYGHIAFEEALQVAIRQYYQGLIR